MDINELRVSAANSVRDLALLPSEVLELLDRLEAVEKDIAIKEEVIASMAAVVKRLDAQCDAAEAEAIEQARLNGIGSEREAALMAKLEAAEKENKILREALAEKVTSETMLRDLSVGNGSIHASFEGGGVHLLVDALAGQFSESGAENYLEMHFHSDVTGPLVTTVQRANGKTPHQLREAAEKERDTLRARVAEMEKQEPEREVVGLFRNVLYEEQTLKYDLPAGAKLYALPGTQTVASSQDEWKTLAKDLLREIERQTCTHEETHRAGFIWEICDACGAEWADDEGGKPEFKWPKVVERAREMLEAAEAKP